MSGETEKQVSGWTVDTYAAHNEALRTAEEKLQTERDRRYMEVGVEREKALKIKETADLAALGLAREIQTYKDEKANELREQISKERGFYSSKDDLASSVAKIEETLKPIQEFVSQQRGRGGGVDNTWKYIFAVIAAVGVFITAYAVLGSHVAPSTAAVTPPTIIINVPPEVARPTTTTTTK